MHLWTEYEGRTVAGSYTLGRLLRSEGRNGFFATSDKAGKSAVIRLTEAHYDEDQLIERWRQVAVIQQQNLIGIERVGKTNFDGVALTFALMEPNDAVLADVLKERPLTTAETLQVARAVAAALTALHGAGLVHEHIDATNVLAVGETVKLRSDCVRECVADKEFNTPEGCAELRRRDLYYFGVMLLECLTLDKELHPNTNLPEPFYRVIPGALAGSMTLEQINAVLTPPGAPKVADAAGAKPAGPAATASPAAAKPAAPTGGVATLPAEPPRPAAPVSAAPAERAQLPLSFRPRNEVRRDVEDEPAQPPYLRWAAYGAGALVVLLLLWHFIGGKPKQTAPAPVVDATPASTGQSAPAVAASRVSPVAAKPSPAVPAPGSAQPGWYVIAYTYNHPEQAQAKADSLARKHSVLNPHVFSPSGHAPYYIALGGPMTQADASTVLRRAKRSGMPRDTFIRNY